MPNYQITRVYEPASKDDGLRVLVDRLWPRGVKKGKADLWLKEIAPSTELRKWFHRQPGNFADFSQVYRAELAKNSTVDELRKLARKHKTITRLYAAKDAEKNHAAVLKRYLARS